MSATKASQSNQDSSSSPTGANTINSNNSNSLRSYLRRLTGFSWTAFRATMRAATGISLTALYASALAATSVMVRNTMKFMLSPLPPSMRYFVQPFLILYYAPLFVLRSVTGPTRKQARQTHLLFLQGWQDAVERAEMKVEDYWPTSTMDEESDEDDINMSEQSAGQ